MPLTDTEIRKSKPSEKPFKLSDSGGLYLYITPAGGKSWRWKYRVGGTEKVMTFGKYPQISLAQARDRHAEARKLLALGTDPMEQRRAEKTAVQVAAATSFATIANCWWDHWRIAKSARHADYVKRRLESDILPRLGARPVTDIEAPELVAMVKAIEERGAYDIAKRALETAGMIFRYSIAHGHSRRNPAAEIRPSDILKMTRAVNFARLDARELPELLKRIEVYQGTHVTRFAMKLISLTFVRTSELIGATWAEFDFEAARWNIPAARMKAKTAHIVPLARQTLEVLESLHGLTGDGALLFPGDRNPARSMSNNTILKALERMGYEGRMTGHGFRGLASTILYEQGYPKDHVELQLAHSERNSVRAAYNHALYLEPRRKMMQNWADFLDASQATASLRRSGQPDRSSDDLLIAQAQAS